MTAAPPPPGLPPAEAAIWVEVVTRNPHSVTGPALEAYVGQVARMRDAQRRIAEEGLVIASPRGDPIPHPAIEIERKAQAEIRAWDKRGV